MSDAMNVAEFRSAVPVSQAAVTAAKENRRILIEYVKSQMQNGRDYGVIPGTPKPSLFQPGAQKLAKLFNLTMRKELVDKTIDREGNFAMFTYRTTVYHGPSDLLISQCEGSCNSQEKKYRERAIYKGKGDNRKFVRMEETPIGDILNTLQKMAQKRSMVGAVIEAVGASDFYTQDIDEPGDAEAIGVYERPAPKRAPVHVPQVKRASSNFKPSGAAAKPAQTSPRNEPEESSPAAPDCPGCGNEMRPSIKNPDDWHCFKKHGGCGVTVHGEDLQ